MSKNVVTWNPGPTSLKVIESDTIRQIAYSFILVFYSNFYSTYKYTVTLKPGLRVTSKMMPFDPALMISY